MDIRCPSSALATVPRDGRETRDPRYHRRGRPPGPGPVRPIPASMCRRDGEGAAHREPRRIHHAVRRRLRADRQHRPMCAPPDITVSGGAHMYLSRCRLWWGWRGTVECPSPSDIGTVTDAAAGREMLPPPGSLPTIFPRADPACRQVRPGGPDPPSFVKQTSDDPGPFPPCPSRRPCRFPSRKGPFPENKAQP